MKEQAVITKMLTFCPHCYVMVNAIVKRQDGKKQILCGKCHNEIKKEIKNYGERE